MFKKDLKIAVIGGGLVISLNLLRVLSKGIINYLTIRMLPVH